MSEPSDTPNIEVDFESPLGDTRTIEFYVPELQLDVGLLDIMLMQIENFANENNKPPPGWPYGAPRGPWTVRDWRRL